MREPKQPSLPTFDPSPIAASGAATGREVDPAELRLAGDGRHHVRLLYAVDPDGLLVHVNDAHRHQRLECYLCGDGVYPRGGRQRAAHFAHRHGGANASGAAVGGPETQLHRQAKWTLALGLTQLARSAGVLKLAVPCPKCHGRRTVERRLAVTDRVYVERGLDRFRPDVTLRALDGPPTLFEVVVTHESSAEKLEWVEGRDLQYLELQAVELEGWTPEAPLAVARSKGLPAGTCERCAQAPRRARPRATGRPIEPQPLGVPDLDGSTGLPTPSQEELEAASRDPVALEAAKRLCAILETSARADRPIEIRARCRCGRAVRRSLPLTSLLDADGSSDDALFDVYPLPGACLRVRIFHVELDLHAGDLLREGRLRPKALWPERDFQCSGCRPPLVEPPPAGDPAEATWRRWCEEAGVSVARSA